jgi:hypothetical protein
MECIELTERKVASSKNSTDRIVPVWEIAVTHLKTVTDESYQYRVLYVTS